MKDIDIEKLERKTNYSVPDGLFDEVQKNVLSTLTTSQKIKKEHSLYWYFSAAASVVILFGLSLFWWNSNASEPQKSDHQSPIIISKTTPIKTLENQQNLVQKPTVISPSPIIEVENIQQNTPKLANNEINNSKNSDLLDGFSGDEIAELSQSTSADVYLDLYTE